MQIKHDNQESPVCKKKKKVWWDFEFNKQVLSIYRWKLLHDSDGNLLKNVSKHIYQHIKLDLK